MKKLMVVVLSTVVLGLSAQVQAGPILDTHLEQHLVNICQALQSDNKLRLRHAIRQSGLTYRSVAKGLRCNGVDAMTFAIQNNANDTANMVVAKGRIDFNSLVAKR